MAQVSQILGEFGDGNIASMAYDNQTYVVHSLTFTSAPGAQWPLTWWYQTVDGDYNTGVVPQGNTTTITNFPKGLTGSIQTNPRTGQPEPYFPFLFYGFGEGTVVTPPPPIAVTT